MGPEQFNAMYGLRPGTVRGWIRDGVIPQGLTGDRLDHAVLAAYTLRPALSAHAGQTWINFVRETHAGHAAAVRDSLARHPEVACPTTPTTDVPSAPAAA